MALVSFKLNQFTVDSIKHIVNNIFPGELADDHHITLCYLGEDYNPVDFVKACETVIDSCHSLQQGFFANASLVTAFPVNNGKYPVVLLVDSIELQDLQKNISTNLYKNNVPFVDSYKFYRPHITLGYTDFYPKQFLDIFKNLPSFSFFIDSIMVQPYNNGFANAVKVSLSSPDMGVFTKAMDPTESLKEFTRAIAAKVAAFRASLSHENQEKEARSPGHFTPETTRIRQIDHTNMFSPVPDTHRHTEQVICRSCTMWINPHRGCPRCSPMRDQE